MFEVNLRNKKTKLRKLNLQSFKLHIKNNLSRVTELLRDLC